MSSQILAKKMTKEVKIRIKKAQEIELKWKDTCSEELEKMITAHASAIGTPIHYIYFPLLTVIGSFMGVNACIHINEEWSEPPILWNVIAARKGEKKTAAMKRILNAVEVSKKLVY